MLDKRMVLNSNKELSLNNIKKKTFCIHFIFPYNFPPRNYGNLLFGITDITAKTILRSHMYSKYLSSLSGISLK